MKSGTLLLLLAAAAVLQRPGGAVGTFHLVLLLLDITPKCQSLMCHHPAITHGTSSSSSRCGSAR
jgi:hypothetical protein